jgi:serine/threonine-protein kinase
LTLLNEQIEGKYEILGKIREGGMGAVYKVRHRLLEEVRVVKVVRPLSDGKKSDAALRFLHEAKVAIRLRHPNVAVLHDFAVDDQGTAFIVMEYIDGWSLLEVLQGYGPPPLSLTLEIARQALRALAYLHRQQIVHRDISPDNLMLSRDGEGQPLVKLIDLGIAKAVGASGGLTTTGVFLGKPRYASPEQFEGRGIGPQSDLYSFAVVLYELLTGRCPVHGQDAPSFMAGHMLRPPMDFDEVDPRGTVPADLRAMILQALAKKPQERMPGAEELVRSIAQVQARYPLARRDFDAVLDVLLPLGSDPGGRRAEPPAGSTQVRLDWEFGAVKTPPPANRGELTPTPAIGALLALPTVRVSEPTREISPPLRGLPTAAGDLPLRWQAAAEDAWAGREIHRTVSPRRPGTRGPRAPPFSWRPGWPWRSWVAAPGGGISQRGPCGAPPPPIQRPRPTQARRRRCRRPLRRSRPPWSGPWPSPPRYPPRSPRRSTPPRLRRWSRSSRGRSRSPCRRNPTRRAPTSPARPAWLRRHGRADPRRPRSRPNPCGAATSSSAVARGYRSRCPSICRATTTRPPRAAVAGGRACGWGSSSTGRGRSSTPPSASATPRTSASTRPPWRRRGRPASNRRPATTSRARCGPS